ncbi:hypothetical protein F7725_025812 [Dissostichus mawsoni]|uniref:Uncharacterized protein n=1 Tax=Dissostichus mawsoni TaxID=36200 RepID=A0A7J5X646_DISMA|nr:hypothetical protein F7725_025812 [Dissostichus mawsoni]
MGSSMASRTTNASSWWPTTSKWPEVVATGSVTARGLPLDRLRAPAAVMPAAAPCQSARVTEAQRRMKQRFDKRRRVRAPSFTVGDWVRIHRLTGTTSY